MDQDKVQLFIVLAIQYGDIDYVSGYTLEQLGTH